MGTCPCLTLTVSLETGEEGPARLAWKQEPPGGALQPQWHLPGPGSWVLPLLWPILCQGAFQGPWRTTRQTSEQETGHLWLGEGLLRKNISCVILGKVRWSASSSVR